MVLRIGRFLVVFVMFLVGDVMINFLVFGIVVMVDLIVDRLMVFLGVLFVKKILEIVVVIVVCVVVVDEVSFESVKFIIFVIGV